MSVSRETYFSAEGFFGGPDPGPEIDLSWEIGALYDGRGMTAEAMAMWGVSSPSCQAALKDPEMTDEGLAEYQKRYVALLGKCPVVPPWKTGNVVPRIGYHCAFMEGDTIRAMMRKVFEAHRGVDLYGYAPSFDLEATKWFGETRFTRGMSDRQFRKLVMRDRIDILVEMTGFSYGHRLNAMAGRCAPVQVSYLNHCGTTGIPNIDYVLADGIACPGSDGFYSEKIWRLPGCFFCFDYRAMKTPPVVEPPCLKNGYMTFGCFGSGGKINRELVALWARVLKASPRSRLRIQNPQLNGYDARRFLMGLFAAEGIGVHRLQLRPAVPRDWLLESYDKVDVSLDTWPYCGGNTIAESLWQGVPVVTLRGDRFASAYGASLVTAAGYPEMIANTPDEYVKIATSITPEYLREQRVLMRAKCTTFGLGDSTKFARTLEDAYRSML